MPMRSVKRSKQPQLEFGFASKLQGRTSGGIKPARISKKKKDRYLRDMENYLSERWGSGNPQKNYGSSQLRFNFANIKAIPKGVKPVPEMDIKSKGGNIRDYAKIHVGEHYFFLPKSLERKSLNNIALLFNEMSELINENKLGFGIGANSTVPLMLHTIEPKLELSRRRIPFITERQEQQVRLANAFLRRAWPKLPRKNRHRNYPAGAR